MSDANKNGLDPKTSRRNREIEKVPSEGVLSFYANNVGLRLSFWDLVMDFGMIVDVDEKKLMIKDVVTVVMSPQHAKVFAEVLASNIKQYEEKFGQIPKLPRLEEEEPSEGDEP